MKHIWLTDCESLHSYLVNPVAALVEDNRLESDLLDLRQILWEDWLGNPEEEITEDECDRCIWIASINNILNTRLEVLVYIFFQ